MSSAGLSRGWLPGFLASLLIVSTAARAGTAINSFGGNGGVVPGAAPHLSGYVVASLEQGYTSAKYSVLSVNQTTHQVSVTGGDRLYNNYNTLPVYTQCAPNVVAKDAFNAYILTMETTPGGSDPAGLYATLISSGKQEKDIQYGTYKQHLVTSDCAMYVDSIGASALPDGRGMIVVTAKPTFPVSMATVRYYTWNPGTDWTLTEAAKADIPLPANLPSAYRGNIVCAVTHNFDRMARWYPYRLTLGVALGEGTVVTREYRLNTKILDSSTLPAATKQRYFVTPITTDDQWHTLATGMKSLITMHTGMDGRVYLAAGTGSAVRVWARTGFDSLQAAQWTQQPDLPTPTYGDGTYPPVFVYKPVFNPAGNPGAPIPINRVAFFTRSSIQGYDDSFGWGRRRQMADANTSQLADDQSAGVVIGIVDGPPPIPNENLQAFPNDTVTSSFQFAYHSNQSSSTQATMGQGVTVGASATLGGEFEGFGASAEIEGEMSQNFTNSYSAQTTTSSEQYLTVNSGTTTDQSGTPVFQKLGTIFLAKIDYSGFVYEFGTIDNNGNFTATPGSLLYTQVFPKGGYNIVPRGWYMNPNGPQPGDLNSYKVSQDELSKLNDGSISKINWTGLTGNTNYIYLSYDNSSTAQTAFDFFAQLDTSHAEEISTKESLKVSATTPVASGSVSASQDTSVTRTWGFGQGTDVGISVNTQVKNDSSPDKPVNYYSETYQVYLLKDDNTWLRELLSDDPNGVGMVTPTWPPIGSIERQRNEALKAQLIRSSTPWKVKYVVTRAVPNKTIGTQGLAGPTLAHALADKLAKSGVTTTGLVDLLLQVADEISHPIAGRQGNVVYSAGRLRFQRAQMRKVDEALARAFPTRAAQARVRALAASLTPQERATLKALLDAVEQADYNGWAGRHAFRYTLAGTLREMQKPAILPRHAEFMTIPPPER